MVRYVIHLLHVRAIRYLLAGGTGAVVHIGTVFVLSHLLEINYRIATVCGFFLAMGVSFTLQKFFTFRDGSKDRIVVQSSLYLILATFNFSANLGLMYLLVERVGLWPAVAQGATAATIAIWSYLAYSRLFKTRTTGVNVDLVLEEDVEK